MLKRDLITECGTTDCLVTQPHTDKLHRPLAPQGLGEAYLLDEVAILLVVEAPEEVLILHLRHALDPDLAVVEETAPDLRPEADLASNETLFAFAPAVLHGEGRIHLQQFESSCRQTLSPYFEEHFERLSPTSLLLRSHLSLNGGNVLEVQFSSRSSSIW